jgi:hypothetical protein
VVEEVHLSGNFLTIINSNFILVIPNIDHPSSFDDFCPIALCNGLYKILTKIIAVRIKPLLSNVITQEQLHFIKGWLIHEAIGSAMEGLHTIKTENGAILVLKINLFKAYNRVSWLYLWMLLMHIGFGLSMVKYIMDCILIISFVVLINVFGSPFFKFCQGL